MCFSAKAFLNGAARGRHLGNLKKIVMSVSHHRGGLLVNVGCGLGTETSKNFQVTLMHREVLELREYLVVLMSFKRTTLFSRRLFS